MAALWVEYRGNPTIALRNRLVESYLADMKKVAMAYHRTLPKHVEWEDVYADAVMGLMQAVERFDPARGVKFTAYAVRRVRGAIVDGIRDRDFASRSHRAKMNRGEGFFTVDGFADIAEKDSGKKTTVLDMLEAKDDPVTGFANTDFKDFVGNLCRYLTKREALLFRLYHVDGVSMAECGRAVGISESMVSVLMKGVMARLRAKLTPPKTV
jgi:RNA polymerase sigma factor FliA